MKKISFMFDYGRKFKTCVVFKDEEEANQHAGDTLQSWIDDYNKHREEYGQAAMQFGQDPAITANDDYSKSKETLRYLLQLNKVEEPQLTKLLDQINPTTLKREWEWYGLIGTLTVEDDKLADNLIEDMNNIREMVENKRFTIDNVFEEYKKIKGKKEAIAQKCTAKSM